jgi:hypothetical protein
LHPDDLLIVSALATPVDGMDLRLEQEKDEIVGNVVKKQESSEQKQP